MRTDLILRKLQPAPTGNRLMIDLRPRRSVATERQADQVANRNAPDEHAVSVWARQAKAGTDHPKAPTA